MHRTIKIDFVDFWGGDSYEEKLRLPFYSLLSQRWDLEITDNPDFVLYSVFGNRFLRYGCTRIFYTGENVRPNFGECDYAFSFDYPVTERNYRLPLYGLWDTLEDALAPKDVDAIFACKSKFCNFVYSNPKATERSDFFHRLSRCHTVDSGGGLFKSIGYRVGNECEFMQPYKFTIAFENYSYPGYTTEKILEAFVAHTVPIYWGNPEVYVTNSVGEKDHEDLWLMSQCKYHIIANSSFSRWGAWLGDNPDRIVVAPRRWSRHGNRDRIPAGWVQV